MTKSNQRGFTLMELIVVIAIMLVLIAIVMVAINNVQMRGRDSKRSSEMAQFVRALEVYRTNTDSYPAHGGTTDGVCTSPNCLTVLTDELVPAYLPVIPVDPRYGNTTNGYRYCRATPPREGYQLIRRSEKDNTFCMVRTSSPITGNGPQTGACWTTNGTPDFEYCD